MEPSARASDAETSSPTEAEDRWAKREHAWKRERRRDRTVSAVVIVLTLTVAGIAAFTVLSVKGTIDTNSRNRQAQDKCVISAQNQWSVAVGDAVVAPQGSQQRLEAGLRLIQANERLRQIDATCYAQDPPPTTR